MNLKHAVRAVAGQFQICGGFISAEPYGSGHINDTYCGVLINAKLPERVTHCKIQPAPHYCC
jgi:hypothetical protein